MAATVCALVVILLIAVPVNGQTGATLQERGFDASGAVIPGATVSVQDPSSPTSALLDSVKAELAAFGQRVQLASAQCAR
jgi:hypothetical protein